MRNLLSQTEIPLGPLRGIGPLGLEGEEATAAPGTFTTFLSKTIGLLTVVAAIWFTFQLLIGAIGIISAGGDKGKVESAKKQITNGLVGLVIVIIAIFIIDLIGWIIGFGFILDPTQILNQ